MNAQETALDLFGSELGSHLIRNKAVLPVQGKIPAGGIKGWPNGVDLDRAYDFDGLAIINGERSGITCYDLDSRDLIPPVSPNVETAKGCHLYTPWEGERRLIRKAPGVDLLGQGGYSIFWGKGKDFKDNNLADASVVRSWFNSLVPITSNVVSPSSTNAWNMGINGILTIGAEYSRLMDEKGYKLELDWIANNYAGTMKRVETGKRNNELFRYAVEIVRCGADLEPLAQAALQTGQNEREVRGTLASATKRANEPAVTVFDRVAHWWTVNENVDATTQQALAYVGERAICTNSLRPLVVLQQAEIETGIPRRTITRRLRAQEGKSVQLKRQQGRQPNGLRHADNYRLMIDGHALERWGL